MLARFHCTEGGALKQRIASVREQLQLVPMVTGASVAPEERSETADESAAVPW
jgi:hypothetical protein